jgi:Spy/CpxP family protein refolding chaperone
MTTTPASIPLALMLVAAALFTSGSAVAQPIGRSGGGGPMGGGSSSLVPLMLRSANLTPDQNAKVRELVAARRASARALQQQLRQAEDDLAGKLLAPGNAHLADVQPQLQQIGQLREQILRDSAQTALDIRALLTPEQLGRAAQANSRMRQLQREMRELWQEGK